MTRSVLGAFLPLAGPSMYSLLGLNWAGTLLGVIVTLCMPILFVFYFKGGQIRQESKIIQRLNAEKVA